MITGRLILVNVRTKQGDAIIRKETIKVGSQ
jgi:hypothetical protein